MGVLGDREFASGKLFGFFNKEAIPFYVRIKDNAQITVGKKNIFSPKKVFNYLKVNEKSIFGAAVFIYGQKVYLSESRSERGELMMVATLNAVKNAIFVYLRRWEIENF